MKKLKSIEQPAIKVSKSYICCDNCDDEMKKSYGDVSFELNFTYEEFRGQSAEMKTYDFCSWKCLKEFMRKQILNEWTSIDNRK